MLTFNFWLPTECDWNNSSQRVVRNYVLRWQFLKCRHFVSYLKFGRFPISISFPASKVNAHPDRYVTEYVTPSNPGRHKFFDALRSYLYQMYEYLHKHSSHRAKYYGRHLYWSRCAAKTSQSVLIAKSRLLVWIKKNGH
jgi:hypothetical protein